MSKIQLIVNKLDLLSIDHERYFSVNGDVIERDPPGSEHSGLWVLRNKNGEYVDRDQYRTDLMERHGFSSPISLDEFIAQEFA